MGHLVPGPDGDDTVSLIALLGMQLSHTRHTTSYLITVIGWTGAADFNRANLAQRVAGPALRESEKIIKVLRDWASRSWKSVIHEN